MGTCWPKSRRTSFTVASLTPQRQPCRSFDTIKIMVKFSRWLLALAAMSALSAVLLLAGDPDCDWKASVDVNGNDVPLTIHLKVKDASVTGAIEGMPTTPADIQNGKIEGDNIT